MRPLERLRHHVTGAIERGEAQAVAGQVATPTCDMPLAAAGLTSYRYKGRYGWIMIGANSHREALSEALRSLSDGSGASMDHLQVWDLLAGRYVPVQS